jgi:hypothetical protein
LLLVAALAMFVWAGADVPTGGRPVAETGPRIPEDKRYRTDGLS